MIINIILSIIMGLYRNTFKIESARLRDWDYSTPWWYYITICTKDMKCWFGRIKNGRIVLNDLGKNVDKFWLEIPKHYPKVELDYYVPNHLHGVVIINDVVETGHAPSLRKNNITLGNIVGSFKSAVTKWARLNSYISLKWQHRFYDHIIRNQNDLDRIRTYILNNPVKWEMDKYNTE